jgi:hypothetical protein
VIIELGVCQDQSRQINDLPGGRGFGEGQGDVLHDRDGALANERDGHRLGAHAVARDAAGGVGACVGALDSAQAR